MANARVVEIPAVQAGEAVSPFEIYNANDQTQFLDIDVLSNGNPVFDMNGTIGGIAFVRSTANYSLMQFQNPLTGKRDSVNDGFTIGCNGLDATIRMRDTSSTMTIGVADADAITIDAARDATFVQNLNANGNVTLGDASDDTHTLNGTIQYASEVASPSAPGAGEGGIFYVKSDGLPYFVSATQAEASLVGGGGGGGITIVAKTVDDSPYSPSAGEFVEVQTGPFTINLPAADNGGDVIDIFAKDASVNAVTISPDGTDTINYSTADLVIFGAARTNVTLVSSGGGNWFIR